MDSTTGVVLVIIILAAVFLVAAIKYRKVEGDIVSPLVKANFKGNNDIPHTTTGTVEISNLDGKNVEIGNVTGAKGSDIQEGVAKISGVTAKKDMKIGDVIGSDSTIEGK
jgi:hypothetical protein